MIENKGFITLDRAILNHWCSSNPNFLAVWIRLLGDANWQTKKSLMNGSIVEIKRGQLIFGLNAFSEKSGVSVMKLRGIIKVLEDEGMINRQKTNKYSIISIVKYDEYQSVNKQKTGKQQADNIQTTTPKQSKQDKQKKEAKITYSLKDDLPDGFTEFRNKYPEKKKADWSSGLDCFVKWMKKGITLDQMLFAIDFWEWSDDQTFRPHPEALLNKKLWKNQGSDDKQISKADEYRLPLETFRDKGIWYDDYGPNPTLDGKPDGPLNPDCKAPVKLIKEILNRGDLI